MQKYLIQRENGVVNIFVKNNKNKCYDSLTQLPAPKYAEITNEQIAYTLDHYDQGLIKKQTHVDYYFDGVFLKYTKIELTYILDHKNGMWSQKEINNKEKSGLVWSWIIGFGLIALSVFVLIFLNCWYVIRKRDVIDNDYFVSIIVILVSVLLSIIIFIENFMKNFWIGFGVVFVSMVVIFFILGIIESIIDPLFEKIRICLTNRDTKKLMEKEKNT
jgi:hypothetical protein